MLLAIQLLGPTAAQPQLRCCPPPGCARGSWIELPRPTRVQGRPRSRHTPGIAPWPTAAATTSPAAGLPRTAAPATADAPDPQFSVRHVENGSRSSSGRLLGSGRCSASQHLATYAGTSRPWPTPERATAAPT
jgi:hypothetical protein